MNYWRNEFNYQIEAILDNEYFDDEKTEVLKELYENKKDEMLDELDERINDDDYLWRIINDTLTDYIRSYVDDAIFEREA